MAFTIASFPAVLTVEDRERTEAYPTTETAEQILAWFKRESPKDYQLFTRLLRNKAQRRRLQRSGGTHAH